MTDQPTLTRRETAAEPSARGARTPTATRSVGRTPSKQEPSASQDQDGTAPRRKERPRPVLDRQRRQERVSRQERVNGAARAVPLAADGTPQLPNVGYDDDGYPCETPPPMTQSASHARELVRVAGLLTEWLAQRHPGAYVGTDSFLYWKKGKPRRCLAPDILVALEPKDRHADSYKLWEQPAPNLVMEQLSPSSASEDAGKKKRRYRKLGIPEYWLLDPKRLRFAEGIRGYRLCGGRYVAIPKSADTGHLSSAELELDFCMRETGTPGPNAMQLWIFDRLSGEHLLSSGEEKAGRLAAERERTEEKAGRLAAEREIERLRQRLRDAGLANGSV